MEVSRALRAHLIDIMTTDIFKKQFSVVAL